MDTHFDNNTDVPEVDQNVQIIFEVTLTDPYNIEIKSSSSNVSLPKNNQPRKRSHICDICDKSFVFRSEIRKHMRTHSGQKPYSCPQCNKSFSQSSNLIKHQVVHTGAKRYTCPQCNMSFGHKPNLKTHEMTHSEEKPYICLQCRKSFNQKRYLRAHQKAKNHW